MSTSTPGSTGDAPSTADDALRRPAFVTTRWSLVISARDRTSPNAAAALEQLCRTYWYPLYAFVRRSGRSKADAEDLTQAFFARLLEKDYLQAACRDRGRFRSFLLVALRRFLANEWNRARARKRGGDRQFLSLDAGTAERRYRIEPADPMTADRLYERRWALTLIEAAMSRLRAEFAEAGQEGEFEALKGFLTEKRTAIPYAELAASLNRSEGALRVAVHRLRKRYRHLFREEISRTVAEEKEVEDEIRHLMDVLSG